MKPGWLHCAADNGFSESEIDVLKRERFDEKLETVADFVVKSAELEYVMIWANESGYSEIICSQGFSPSAFLDKFERRGSKAIAKHRSHQISREELDQIMRDLEDQFMAERL